MSNFVTEGGWGIFPVLLCGAIAVLLSMAFAISLRREIVPLLAGFLIATLLSGCLGSLVGVQGTIRHVTALPAFDPNALLIGVRESLNNAVAAIQLGLLSVLLTIAGGFRAAWRAAARG